MRQGRLLRNGQPVAGWTCSDATSWLERAAGLLFRAPLAADECLRIAPCSSVHTIGMRYPIDVVFVDRAGRVAGMSRHVRPLRAAMCLKADATFEFRVGAIDRLGLALGDTLVAETG